MHDFDVHSASVLSMSSIASIWAQNIRRLIVHGHPVGSRSVRTVSCTCPILYHEPGIGSGINVSCRVCAHCYFSAVELVGGTDFWTQSMAGYLFKKKHGRLGFPIELYRTHIDIVNLSTARAWHGLMEIFARHIEQVRLLRRIIFWLICWMVLCKRK
jgi:hypothetical protein